MAEPWNIGPNRFPTTAENKYLKVSAFAYPAPYTPGNLGRNTFRGPILYWTQTSLAKEVPIRERLKFTMKANIGNVFKRPEFSAPSSTYNTSNQEPFGVFTGSVGAFSGIGGPFNVFLIFRLDF